MEFILKVSPASQLGGGVMTHAVVFRDFLELIAADLNI
jgi:hypothetical protein